MLISFLPATSAETKLDIQIFTQLIFTFQEHPGEQEGVHCTGCCYWQLKKMFKMREKFHGRERKGKALLESQQVRHSAVCGVIAGK